MDKKREENKAVKDDMLRKYLRSRQNNEQELERAAARLRPRRQVTKRRLERDHADHFDDVDPFEESRDTDRHDLDRDEEEWEDDSQISRLRDLKRRIQEPRDRPSRRVRQVSSRRSLDRGDDESEDLGSSNRVRPRMYKKMPPFKVRAGRLAQEEVADDDLPEEEMEVQLKS